MTHSFQIGYWSYVSFSINTVVNFKFFIMKNESISMKELPGVNKNIVKAAKLWIPKQKMEACFPKNVKDYQTS